MLPQYHPQNVVWGASQVWVSLFSPCENLVIIFIFFPLFRVLRRVCTLISAEANLIESNEASVKQVKKLTAELEDLKKVLQII